MTRKTIRPKKAKINTPACAGKRKFRLIVSCFCDDFTAYETSKIVKVNRHTVENYFNKFRRIIYKQSLKIKRFNGEVEIDESYFGPTRIRGKRGRGAGFKIPVVGLLKRNDKVYTKIIANCTKEELLPVIKGKVLTGSTIYTDGWTSYDGLILYGYKHKRIHHGENEFVRGKNHINSIESFWSYVKRRLRKFNGVPKHKFLLYLKESEWKFNHRQNMKQSFQKLLRNISYSY